MVWCLRCPTQYEVMAQTRKQPPIFHSQRAVCHHCWRIAWLSFRTSLCYNEHVDVLSSRIIFQNSLASVGARSFIATHMRLQDNKFSLVSSPLLSPLLSSSHSFSFLLLPSSPLLSSSLLSSPLLFSPLLSPPLFSLLFIYSFSLLSYSLLFSSVGGLSSTTEIATSEL